jgi:purine-cytosine permease-like protein
MKTEQSTASRGRVDEVVDRVGRIENVGVEFIPEDQRRSKLINVFWILFGGSMTFGIIIIGWIPISLGLGWWEALSAIVVGTAVGSFLLAPMSLFGPRTGTNNPVASGAHFGAKGRLIGSMLGVTACIVFAALCVWAAGDVLAGSVARVTGNEDSQLQLQLICYALVSVVMVGIAVLGHANMVVFCKLMVPTAGVLMVVGIFAYYPTFDASYQPGDYALGSFWPTWIAGAIVCAATTNSYGPYAGDWTRHVSREKYSDKQLMIVTWLGGFIGMGGAYVWGAYTSASFADPTMDYALGLVVNAPTWYLLPLLYIGLVAGTAQAVINIYSMGLDFSAIVPRFSRVECTIGLGMISTALVYMGAFYEQIALLVTSFLAILVILGAPWVVVNIVGLISRRGYYYSEHLQVFNRSEIGGRYWFAGGLNWQATTAWALGVAAGALFINTGWYVAPGAALLGGADTGLFVSSFVSAAAYILLLYRFPEPAAAYGPDGAYFQHDGRQDYPPIRPKRSR